MTRERRPWSLLSMHGLVLVALLKRPDATLVQLAEELGASRITILRTLHDLRDVGMVQVVRRGRRNTYSVDAEVNFRHPSMRQDKIAVLVGAFKPAGAIEAHEGETPGPE